MPPWPSSPRISKPGTAGHFVRSYPAVWLYGSSLFSSLSEQETETSHVPPSLGMSSVVAAGSHAGPLLGKGPGPLVAAGPGGAERYSVVTTDEGAGAPNCSAVIV